MRHIVLFTIAILTLAGIATAEQTSYKQQILPIDCIYEVIDVGTQKLRYLTPETCPVDPGPPVITEPPTASSPDEITEYNWTYYAPIELIKPATDTSLMADDDEQVMGVTEQLRDVVYGNHDSLLFVIGMACVWVVVLYVLIKKKQLP
jgi:hypothetical protein